MHTGYALFALSPFYYFVTTSAHFILKDTFIGQDFMHGFNWETFDDPTHGRVNFVNQSVAVQANLSFASATSFIMRADDLNVVPPSARGRNSVRITSHNSYADSMIVVDVKHIPEGCGTWPAFWTLSKAGPWPQGGEIDIIEGANSQPQNMASLHTTSGCSVAQNRSQTGLAVSTACDASVNNNQGCGTSFSKPGSYGSQFNIMGGGWYVMQRTAQDGISVYFWSRNDARVPAVVKYGAPLIVLDPTWGAPEAYFPKDSCDYSTHFDAHQIIFDLTFCGDWAGNTFASSNCGKGTCEDFVNTNPKAFVNAYWEIDSLRVYTPLL
ncbi:hypothetical protein BD410DRAFT_894166 [Rickenella mellea]|uniref:GH16 domain-containing protein n=1 Tax=Rickenella mellea TaxID=50990 RepID=A0A4Y7QK69_9AGAM|nr:hypothetical protein BD410DRAFT_894166 [Rickenella mellea]